MTVLKSKILSSPLKVLGATVLSFNTRLGLGQDESTISLDVIEDCVNGDRFLPLYGEAKVGDPVYFQAGDFSFNGMLRDWSSKKGPEGKTHTVNIVDPRSLLTNTSIVVDTYRGMPITAPNYANVFYYMEQNFCADFGLSGNSEEGTPYNAIMAALIRIQNEYGPFVFSSTGQPYKVDFNGFPGSGSSGTVLFPKFYRIDGPSIILSELLENACDMIGCAYYAYLTLENGFHTIKIGLINLQVQPTSFSSIVNRYDGEAQSISYGQEIRNEKTKTMLIGENIHSMATVSDFIPYFGDDPGTNTIEGSNSIPVIPYGYDNMGFWINKVTLDLDMSLGYPAFGYGPYQVSEMDIRMAMSGFEAWSTWVFIYNAKGSFNDKIRNITNNLGLGSAELERLVALQRSLSGQQLVMNLFQHVAGHGGAFPDIANAISQARNNIQKPIFLETLEKIHNWLSTLGNNYYGKTYLGRFIDKKICFYYNLELSSEGTDRIVYSATPADAGWIEPALVGSNGIIGLKDPYLYQFKNEDGRLLPFAVFNNEGIIPQILPYEESTGKDDSMFCWVAREVYGYDDYRWLIFRYWLTNDAPLWLFNVYSKYGQKFAKYIRNKKHIKNMLKIIMNYIIYQYRN